MYPRDSDLQYIAYLCIGLAAGLVYGIYKFLAWLF